MKTVCPHCHQKYDVPDDYLQQDVTCQKCEKDFTVTQAKFCIKCGKANPAQALQCYACQQVFETAVKNASIRITPPHEKAESEESENADFDASVTPHWSGYLALGLGIACIPFGFLCLPALIVGAFAKGNKKIRWAGALLGAGRIIFNVIQNILSQL